MSSSTKKTTAQTPQILLKHHLKALRLPTFLREYEKLAALCAKEKVDYATYLLRLAEKELLERERHGAERRIKQAAFPSNKTLDDFDFAAAPSLNKKEIFELARCEWLDKKENLILMGNPGCGKSHLAMALGRQSCQRGYNVRMTTAAGLINSLVEARNEKSLLRLQKQLNKVHLLIIDEMGYIPFSKTGAELLFEVFSQRYERGSVLVTTNLPFEEWTSILQSERLTGALLDRLTHRVHILALQEESYRLSQSKRRKRTPHPEANNPKEDKDETINTDEA